MSKIYIDKLAFIDLKDKRVLVTLSKGKTVWYMPGGKREGSESDKEALVREVKEELSVDLDIKSIEYYGSFEAQAHGKPEGTWVRMMCYTAKFDGELKAASEIEEYRYVDYSWKDKTSLVDQIIFDDLSSKKLIQ